MDCFNANGLGVEIAGWCHVRGDALLLAEAGFDLLFAIDY